MVNMVVSTERKKRKKNNEAILRRPIVLQHREEKVWNHENTISPHEMPYR